MTRIKSALIATILLSVAASSAASAGWLHFASAVLQAEQEVQKHPAKLTQKVIVPKASASPLACAGYSNNLPQKAAGKVTTLVRVEFADGTVETKKLVGRVRQGAVITCKKLVRDLAVGAEVVFEHSFKGFARLRWDDFQNNFAEMTSVISTAGVPKLGQNAPLGFVPARGTAPFGLLPERGQGWFHSVRSIFQADKASEKHPSNWEQTAFIPEETGNPTVCVAYSTVSDQKAKGKVVAAALIQRGDGKVERLKFAGPVRGEEFLRCKQPAKKLLAGEDVHFLFQFKGMARLDGSAVIDVTGAVTTSGPAEFRKPPPPPKPDPKPDPPTPTPPPPPPPPPGPNPPPGGGGISSADEIAVSTLMINNTKVQLWRSKDELPKKWSVVGPKTRAVPGTNQLVASTAGFGDTPAAAVADYERKQGSLGPRGPRLNAADRAGLVWYASLNASGGPTSVRRDSAGNYYGEYYRPSHGAQHNGPLKSLAAAFNWLRSRLGG